MGDKTMVNIDISGRETNGKNTLNFENPVSAGKKGVLTLVVFFLRAYLLI